MFRSIQDIAFTVAVPLIIFFSGHSIANVGELHDAVYANDRAALKALLDGGADVNATDFIFGTPLHVAASEGNARMAEILIAHGADLEAASEQQSARAAHLAAQSGDASVLALLIDSGADIEARDDVQRTPLSRAAAGGHVEAVRLLLGSGANVDAKEGRFGRTPLHSAVFHGHLDVAKLLVAQGANVNAVSNTGQTPFWLAVFLQSYTVVGDASLLEYLLAQGADSNVKDASGLSPLACADFQVRQGAVVFQEIANELRRLGATE